MNFLIDLLLNLFLLRLCSFFRSVQWVILSCLHSTFAHLLSLWQILAFAQQSLWVGWCLQPELLLFIDTQQSVSPFQPFSLPLSTVSPLTSLFSSYKKHFLLILSTTFHFIVNIVEAFLLVLRCLIQQQLVPLLVGFPTVGSSLPFLCFFLRACWGTRWDRLSTVLCLGWWS